VRSTAGYQTPSCTVATATSFACTWGSGQVSPGAQVRQQNSISSVSISVTEPEPGGDYTYSLQATPRVWASRFSGASGFGPGAPFAAALVTLSGSGTSLTGGTVAVDGSASFGAPLTASGAAAISAQGNINTDGLISCSGAGTVTMGPTSQSQCGITGTTPTSDPLGPLLGIATPQGLSTQQCPSTWSPPIVQLNPGIYRCKLIVPSGDGVALTPGVYEIRRGISVAGSMTMANNSGGALLYLNCPVGASSCSEPDQFAPGATVSIAPLTASQSTQYFPTLGTPALQHVWLWQISANTAPPAAPATLIGNGGTGTAYLPGATVDISGSAGGSTGRIIAGNITMSGGSLTLTGQ
jgi:hypothetical protein